MALEMRGGCKHCHVTLARDGDVCARVFECTICPDHGGERVRRVRVRCADLA
jgi:hypothetical protein